MKRGPLVAASHVRLRPRPPPPPTSPTARCARCPPTAPTCSSPRVDGQFHACTAFCTHYGAPLGDRLALGHGPSSARGTTPCSNVTSGALCEPPAADALRSCSRSKWRARTCSSGCPTTQTSTAKRSHNRESDGRVPSMGSWRGRRPAVPPHRGRGSSPGRGRGASGVGLHRPGSLWSPRSTARPTTAPSSRKGISPARRGADALPLREGAFYERHGIEVWTERTATSLDPDTRTVTFDKRDPVVYYDACLVATGGTPRRLPVEGARLDGVFLLRSWADAKRIVEQADGAECAACDRGLIHRDGGGVEPRCSGRSRVTVIGKEEVPFEGRARPRGRGGVSEGSRREGRAVPLGVRCESHPRERRVSPCGRRVEPERRGPCAHGRRRDARDGSS